MDAAEGLGELEAVDATARGNEVEDWRAINAIRVVTGGLVCKSTALLESSLQF